MTPYEISEQVRALRVEAGLSQVEMARAAGVSRALVQRLERGDSDGISLYSLYRILDALDASIEITRTPEPSHDPFLPSP